jgi:hypothetical protein
MSTNNGILPIVVNPPSQVPQAKPIRLVAASDFSISEIIVPAYQAKMAELRSQRDRMVVDFTKIDKEVQGIDAELQKALAKVKAIEVKLGLVQKKKADAQVDIDQIDAKLKQQQEELDMMTGVSSNSSSKRSAETEIDRPAKRSRTVESESDASTAANQGVAPMVIDSVPAKETTPIQLSDEDAADILSGLGSPLPYPSGVPLPVLGSTTNAQKKAQEKAAQKKLEGQKTLLQTFFKPGTRVYNSTRQGLIQSYNPETQTFAVVFGSHTENLFKTDLLYVPAIGDRVLMRAKPTDDSQKRYYKATVLGVDRKEKTSHIEIRWDEYEKEEVRECRSLDTVLPYTDDSQLSVFKRKFVTDSGHLGTSYYI